MYKMMFIYTSSYIIKNKYCHYTLSCVMRNTLSCIREIFVLYIVLYNEKYIFFYNKNIYSHYTSSCITETNILLYVFLYNRNKYFIIRLLA